MYAGVKSRFADLDVIQIAVATRENIKPASQSVGYSCPRHMYAHQLHSSV